MQAIARFSLMLCWREKKKDKHVIASGKLRLNYYLYETEVVLSVQQWLNSCSSDVNVLLQCCQFSHIGSQSSVDVLIIYRQIS